MTIAARKLLVSAIITAVVLPASSLSASEVWTEPQENIYWGDLHVHTNFSLDAFFMFQTPGRYADEAGMFALHCAKLDFYAVTDHAESLTRNDYWEESIRAARSFNAYGREHPTPDGDPSIIAFTGWEWTQQDPWGHKNVILKYDDPDKLPPSPIRCYKGFLGFRPRDWFANQDLTFLAETPEKLYSLLETYCTEAGTGCEAVVIPHGTAWGQLNIRVDWEVQLNPKQHSPELQRLIEVYSKHGNSEEYRYFHPDYRYYREGIEVDPAACTEAAPCERVCQEPTEVYEPCCWRAGEIVRARCTDPASEFCGKQIELARQAAMPFPEGVPYKEHEQLKPEYRSRPGKVELTEWGACEQCLDCYQPAFNYHPNSSVQKALASAYFGDDGSPLYYRFGFINSTDTHDARPASVMEEKQNVEAVMAKQAGLLYDISRTIGLGAGGLDASVRMWGYERIANYLNPGGLVAILAGHRTRDALWQSLLDRHVYGTSGARIDLWLRAEVHDAQDRGRVVQMGDITTSTKAPTFHLKARGALREDGTCRYDDHPEIRAAMSKEDFRRICFCQCFSPQDERVPIARIEVVKIRQPLTRAEAEMENLKWSPENPGGLIMDPYATFEFDGAQIDWTWTDKGFVDEKPGRSLAYYFRVIQKPTPGYNCRPTARLTGGGTCKNGKPRPIAVAKKANPQDGSEPVPRDSLDDACFSDAGDEETFCEERAWTSPIYIVKE